ncbi:hypothetical protein BN187_3270005 [Clostridioides difficile E12]|nr:hypothetical protein BN187_3270005 [Clostridioides difficile E12]
MKEVIATSLYLNCDQLDKSSNLYFAPGSLILCLWFNHISLSYIKKGCAFYVLHRYRRW